MKIYFRLRKPYIILVSIIIILLMMIITNKYCREDILLAIQDRTTYNDTESNTKLPKYIESIEELNHAIEIAADQLSTHFTVEARNINYSELEEYSLYNNKEFNEVISCYQISGNADADTYEMQEITVDITYKIMYEVSKMYKEQMKGYTISPMAQEVLVKIESILETLELEKMTSDYEKEKAIHNYIITNTEYTEHNKITEESTDPIYGVEGVLLNKNAVCQGYAETMKLFMDILGIESKIITGVVNDNEPHAWNLVKLDGEWYHVDVTWDDAIPEHIGYSYFNITDEMIKDDHIKDENKIYPVANGEKYFYYKDHPIVETSEELKNQLGYILDNKVESGEIYCSYKIDISELEEKINEISVKYDMTIKYCIEGKLFKFDITYL